MTKCFLTCLSWDADWQCLHLIDHQLTARASRHRTQRWGPQQTPGHTVEWWVHVIKLS
ncbi:unnamed protein product [Prunus brigantina]